MVEILGKNKQHPRVPFQKIHPDFIVDSWEAWKFLTIIWNYPPPSDSHQQDYSIFSKASL